MFTSVYYIIFKKFSLGKKYPLKIAFSFAAGCIAPLAIFFLFNYLNIFIIIIFFLD